jgi:hypothetical protein
VKIRLVASLNRPGGNGARTKEPEIAQIVRERAHRKFSESSALLPAICGTSQTSETHHRMSAWVHRGSYHAIATRCDFARDVITCRNKRQTGLDNGLTESQKLNPNTLISLRLLN